MQGCETFCSFFISLSLNKTIFVEGAIFYEQDKISMDSKQYREDA